MKGPEGIEPSGPFTSPHGEQKLWVGQTRVRA